MSSTGNTKRKRRKRGDLTRDEVVTAALEIIDDEGLDSLTMRRLAAKLDCGIMTLYGHVQDRGDLVRTIVVQLFGEVHFVAEPGDTWADVMRRAADTYYAMVCRHPNAYPLIAAIPPDEPDLVVYMANAAAALSATGISLESAYEFFALADAFATGFSLAMTAAASLRDRVDSGEVATSRDASVAERARRLASAEMWAKGVATLIAGSQQTLGLPPIV